MTIDLRYRGLLDRGSWKMRSDKVLYTWPRIDKHVDDPFTVCRSSARRSCVLECASNEYSLDVVTYGLRRFLVFSSVLMACACGTKMRLFCRIGSAAIHVKKVMISR